MEDSLCNFYSKKFLYEAECAGSRKEFRTVRVLLFHEIFVETTKNFTVCSNRLGIRVSIRTTKNHSLFFIISGDNNINSKA